MLFVYLVFPYCTGRCSTGMGQQFSVWQESQAKMQCLKQRKGKEQSRFGDWKDYIEKEAATADYTDALSIGARLNTNVCSGGLYFLKHQSAGKQILWELHFSEIKQEKEIKQGNTEMVFKNLGKGRSYIFGKINNVYTL